MAEKTCSFSEAMALLKGSLAGLGLEHTGISIACCGGSRGKSSLIAQKLVAGGFGREVKPADKSVRYETRDGWFSWGTVEDGAAMINLFTAWAEMTSRLIISLRRMQIFENMLQKATPILSLLIRIR